MTLKSRTAAILLPKCWIPNFGTEGADLEDEFRGFHVVAREHFKHPTAKISAKCSQWFSSYGLFIAHIILAEILAVGTVY